MGTLGGNRQMVTMIYSDHHLWSTFGRVIQQTVCAAGFELRMSCEETYGSIAVYDRVVENEEKEEDSES